MLSEEEIRQFCFRLELAEGEQFTVELAELRSTLRKYSEKAENRALAMLLRMPLKEPMPHQKDRKEEARTDLDDLPRTAG